MLPGLEKTTAHLSINPPQRGPIRPPTPIKIPALGYKWRPISLASRLTGSNPESIDLNIIYNTVEPCRQDL